MFGTSSALLILMVFFFLLPSAFRGARLAVAGKKNNIKDWLPSDFRETVELEWFAKYFVGESFVVATWDGCTPDDQWLSLLATKLRGESAERDLSNGPSDIKQARKLAENSASGEPVEPSGVSAIAHRNTPLPIPLRHSSVPRRLGVSIQSCDVRSAKRAPVSSARR